MSSKSPCSACSTEFSSPLLGQYDAIFRAFRHDHFDMVRSLDEELEANATRDIDRYTNEINRLKSLAFDLEVGRGKLEKIAISRKTLMAPVRRLPTEILSLIFSYCGDPINDNLTRRSLSVFPINTSQVCRRWRSILLKTPELWAHISLDLDHLFVGDDPDWEKESVDPEDEHYDLVYDTARLFKIYVKRSRGALLNISISFGGIGVLPLLICKVLKTCTLRLRSLSLTLIPECFPNHTSMDWTFGLDGAPNLEELTISLPDDLAWETELSASYLTNFPRLSNLRVLNDFDFEYGDSLTSETVRKMTSEKQTLSSLLSFLRKCPNILQLAVLYPLHDVDIPPSRFSGSKIQHLTLDIPRVGRNFLDHLQCPELKHLTIKKLVGVDTGDNGSRITSRNDFEPSEWQESYDALIKMFDRSGSSALEDLILDSVIFHHAFIPSRIFTHSVCDFTRSLTLSGMNSQSLVAAVVALNGPGVPRLRNFTIDAMDEYPDFTDALCDMIFSRSCVLETVSFTWNSSPRDRHSYFIQRLDKLRALGVKVHIFLRG